MKKELKKFNLSQIDDYQNRLTDKQKKLLITHCNQYNIPPVICAWYEDTEDFIDEWIQYGYNRTEARYKLNMSQNEGEFKTFNDGTIIRLVL